MNIDRTKCLFCSEPAMHTERVRAFWHQDRYYPAIDVGLCSSHHVEMKCRQAERAAREATLDAWRQTPEAQRERERLEREMRAANPEWYGVDACAV